MRRQRSTRPSLGTSDTAVHTLPEEPFLHRSSTGPDVQQVVIRRLVTPLHRKGIDEPLEAFAELAVLTEELRFFDRTSVGFLPVVTQSPTACQAVAISLP